MSRFRHYKAELLRLCAGADWQQALEQRIANDSTALECANPLLALLPRREFCWQAAYGLGLAVSRMAGANMEAARIFMRRLMWSMNEESGNLGWGVPEAMGCILAESPALAGEYGRILISYGRDTGREDNYVEHAPLRRGVYWGIGRLAAANAAVAAPALSSLAGALADKDLLVRGMAAFAVRELAGNMPAEEKRQGAGAVQWRTVTVALELAFAQNDATLITLLDGQNIVSVRLADMLAQALAAARISAVLEAE